MVLAISSKRAAGDDLDLILAQERHLLAPFVGRDPADAERLRERIAPSEVTKCLVGSHQPIVSLLTRSVNPAVSALTVQSTRLEA